jgi:hypothetical protein
LSLTEAATHFGAWSVVSAPLVIGMNMSDTDTVNKYWSIVTNIDAIEINQDYAGFSGSLFASSKDTQDFTPCGWWASHCSFAKTMSWYKPLSGRDVRKSTMAILLMNNADTAAALSFKFADVPGLAAKTKTCTFYDVNAQKSLGPLPDGHSFPAVPSRGSVFLTLSSCA